MAIKSFPEFLQTIPDPDNRKKMNEVIAWVKETYPELDFRMAWSQPMFTAHSTFIIGFSAAAKHLAVSPERATMLHFEDNLKSRGTNYSKMLVRMPWNEPIDYELISSFINYQLETKKDIHSFWRP